MTAINLACETSLHSFRDFHDYSSLGQAALSEYEFMSSTNGEPITWGQYLDYILYGTQYPTKKKAEESVQKKIDEQKLPNPNCNELHTVWDVIRSHPKLTKFSTMLANCNYKKINTVDYPVTVFAPIDELFDYVLGPSLDLGVYSLQSLQAARYHTLAYPVQPKQLKGRLYQLQSDLDGQRFFCDWRTDEPRLINQTGLDFNDPIEMNSFIPKSGWDVKLLGSVSCAGGWVYLVDRPMLFPSVL
jgi:hypothetical protein